jgi:hypothetical protein
MFPGSTGCQPVLFGSLPKRNVVGKLSTTAGKLPAPPGTENAPLQLRWHAHVSTSAQSKSPGIMRGACNTNSRIGDDIHRRICVASKTVLWVGAQIHLVLATSNAERLR